MGELRPSPRPIELACLPRPAVREAPQGSKTPRTPTRSSPASSSPRLKQAPLQTTRSRATCVAIHAARASAASAPTHSRAARQRLASKAPADVLAGLPARSGRSGRAGRAGVISGGMAGLWAGPLGRGGAVDIADWLSGGHCMRVAGVGDQHGIPGSYAAGYRHRFLARHPGHAPAGGAGLGLPAIDPPGGEGSDRSPRHSLSSWARDATGLADQQGLGRFACAARRGGHGPRTGASAGDPRRDDPGGRT